jgi:hypothetical protein
MKKTLNYFEMYELDFEYLGQFERVGLDKNSKNYNEIVRVDRYALTLENKKYILEEKTHGRPQKLLFDDESRIVINVVGAAKFIREIKKKFELSQDFKKQKIVGKVVQVLRKKLQLKPDEFGKKIGKSGLTIIRYEAGSLRIPYEVITLMMLEWDISSFDFVSVLDKYKEQYKLEDFKFLKKIEKGRNLMKKEFLTVNEVADLCRIKKQKAYEIIRECNNDLAKRGYITISGRVNRKYLFKKLGLGEVENASL